jgi:hypothetical protein
MNFLWEPKTNSFDVKVRVVSVSPINQWSAGAIEVRDGPVTPNGGGWELARHYFIKVDYSGPDPALDGSGTGARAYEFNCRTAPGDPAVRETGNTGQGQSRGTWNTVTVPGSADPGVPTFPNAWIRIARQRSADGTSDHLLGYSSKNGVDWNLRVDANLNDAAHAGFPTDGGTNAGPWPSVCYVGLASVSHTGIANNNATNNGTVGEFWYSPAGEPYRCFVNYRDYGDMPQVVVGPTVDIKSNSDGTLSITFTGALYSSDTADGTYTKVTGAVSPFPVDPKTSGKTAVFYRAGP